MAVVKRLAEIKSSVKFVCGFGSEKKKRNWFKLYGCVWMSRWLRGAGAPLSFLYVGESQYTFS